jgi:Ca2+-binding EF-hand superfamily protein
MNEEDSETARQIIEKIKKRGSRGIVGMSRTFALIDRNRNGLLEIDDFERALKDYRICTTRAQAESVFRTFDIDNSGVIQYSEFLRAVVGQMNDFRRDLAEQAFRKLDTDSDNHIVKSDIKRRFNAKRHPDVTAGARSEEEVLCEFLDTFEAVHSAYASKTSSENQVDLAAWLRYYNYVSCNIDSDGYFAQLLQNTFDL